MSIGLPKDVFTGQPPSGIGTPRDVFFEGSGGGGGAGTVESVDVSGGTTGLSTTGGPVTDIGTITLHILNAVQLAGRNSTNTGDVGMIGVNAGNQVTVSSNVIVDSGAESITNIVDTNTTSSTRGIVSKQFTNTNNGGRISGFKARGTHASPLTAITGDSGIVLAGEQYDGTNFLTNALIRTVAESATTGSIPAQWQVLTGDGSTDLAATGTPRVVVDSAGQVRIAKPDSGIPLTTGTATHDLKYPVADGTTGQVIKTDGSGNLAFGSGSGASLAATRIGYGDVSNDLTGDAEHTWNTTTKVRQLNELIDSTSMTESKVQPFHVYQITNKVREPGSIGAINFDNTGGASNASATTGSSYNSHSKLSLSFWFYQTAYHATTCVVTLRGTSALFFLIPTSAGVSMQWDSLQISVGSTPDPALNTWHHVACISDDTVGGGTETLYFDNVMVGTIGGRGARVATNLASGNQFVVGAETTAGGDPYRGKVDELQIYADYAFTSGDVATLYNSGAGTTNTVNGGVGLIGQYHFDAPSGTTAADASASALTLTLTGGGGQPTWVTGLMVASPVLNTVNVISSRDGVINGENGVVVLGDTNGTLQWGLATSATATSGAGTLPGNPLGFFNAKLPDGTPIRVPYYNS